MNDQDLLRYSRQIMLHQIDVEGQQKILDSTMLLIGMGGLGSPSALYLAAAGVGHLVIADFDKVEISNLQRQVIHHTPDIGKYKVDSAKDKMLAINPDIKITTIKNLDEDNLNAWVSMANVVLDGTDNFETRFKINAACVQEKQHWFQLPLFVLRGSYRSLKVTSQISLAINACIVKKARIMKIVQKMAFLHLLQV